MKKIALIGPIVPYKGGLSHFNTSLVDELRKSNSVKVISWYRQYPKIVYPIDSVEPKDLERIKNDKAFMLDFHNPFTWIKAVIEIRSYDPEIVIFPWVSPIVSPIYSFISYFLRKKTKILAICHNVSQHEETFVDGILRRLFFRNVDFFLVHSRKDFEELENMAYKKKIILGFHPVYDMFKAHKNPSIKNYYTIMFFGYVREYKGLIYLIRAMPKILKEFDVKLLVVGEFWEDKRILTKVVTKIVTGRNRTGEEYYLDEIRKLGIKNNVEIVDKYIPNEDVWSYFSKCDMLVLPYTSATQSGPVQIAYNFNIPVICTNVGGLPDVVFDGKTGYIVEPKNPDKIADAVIKFYRKNKKKEFIDHIKKVKERFSWNKYAELINELLDY